MLLNSIQLIFERIGVFVLVLFRVGGLVTVGPLLGMTAIPVKIKIMLALVLAMAAFPLVSEAAFVPNSYVELAVAVGSEMLIGIAMGFVLTLMFLGVKMGAEMISQQMGLSMSRLIDPTSCISTTVMSQLFLLLATLLYVIMNGHLILIRALANTFRTIPLMAVWANRPIVDGYFVGILTASYQLGIRIAGPVLVAIFLVTLALGFVSRTMPQLNILAAGFPLRITLAFFMLITSVGMICALFQDSITMALEQIGYMFM